MNAARWPALRRAASLGDDPIVGDTTSIDSVIARAAHCARGLQPGSRRSDSLLGHLTEPAASELRGETMVMGIPSISLDHGLMSHHQPEIPTERGSGVVIADGARAGADLESVTGRR